MTWFYVSLLSSFFFAISSLIDKHYIEKTFKKTSALSLVILSALAGLPLLFLLIVFSELLPDIRAVLFGFTAGWLVLAGTNFYFKSLKHADAAVVMAIFQLVLPFNYIFGLIFFDEILTILQIIGALTVVIGSITVSFEEQESGWKLKHNSLIYMILASFLVSLSDVIFKFGGKESEFMPLAIAEYSGVVLAGLIIYFLNPRVKKELNEIFHTHKTKILKITQINEAFYLGATFLFRYALIIGPIALVQATVGTSPIFLLLLGWVGGVILPKFKPKKAKLNDTLIRIFGMIISCIGILVMSL